MTESDGLTTDEKRVLWAVQFGALRWNRNVVTDSKCWLIGDWCVDDIVYKLHDMRMLNGDKSEWELTPLGRSHL